MREIPPNQSFVHTCRHFPTKTSRRLPFPTPIFVPHTRQLFSPALYHHNIHKTWLSRTHSKALRSSSLTSPSLCPLAHRCILLYRCNLFTRQRVPLRPTSLYPGKSRDCPALFTLPIVVFFPFPLPTYNLQLTTSSKTTIFNDGYCDFGRRFASYAGSQSGSKHYFRPLGHV